MFGRCTTAVGQINTFRNSVQAVTMPSDLAWLHCLTVQAELEEELKAEAAAGGWLSDPAQLARYEQLKLEADAKASRLKTECSTATTRLQVLWRCKLPLEPKADPGLGCMLSTSKSDLYRRQHINFHTCCTKAVPSAGQLFIVKGRKL